MSGAISNFFQSLWKKINQKGLESEHQYVPLAAIGFFSFVFYYFIWRIIESKEYQNIYLRIIGASLCLFLLFKDYWPKSLKPILPIYWYITLLYCFPFFFTFMLFKSNSSNIWLMTTMTGLFFLMLLVDYWVALLVLIILGVGLAWISYVLTTNPIQIPVDFLKTLPTYLTVLIAGRIFIYRSETIQQAKLQTIEAIGASIAHELRTPLRAISSAAYGIKQSFPILLESYQLAKDHKLPVEFISPNRFKALSAACNNIESETESAFTVINMLLINVTQSVNISDFKICSINQCVDETLRRYPFDKGEAELIHWERKEDFNFSGNEILIIHVLFNLLKNSLYQIKAAHKGIIQIWTKKDTNYNTLHFKDTAKGIPAKILPNIFNLFFTRTYHGTGIGLAFCKIVMENLGGKITCYSVENEYAEFVLYFPSQASRVVSPSADENKV